MHENSHSDGDTAHPGSEKKTPFSDPATRCGPAFDLGMATKKSNIHMHIPKTDNECPVGAIAPCATVCWAGWAFISYFLLHCPAPPWTEGARWKSELRGELFKTLPVVKFSVFLGGSNDDRNAHTFLALRF